MLPKGKVAALASVSHVPHLCVLNVQSQGTGGESPVKGLE